MTGWNTDTLAQTAGAGAITIVEGSSFCVSAANGDIVPELPHGVFYRDTRLVSRWSLLIDGAPVEALSSTTPQPFQSVMIGRAGHVPGRADTALIVERDRRVDNGLNETLTLKSFSREPTVYRVELVAESDFADIFEVKEGRATGEPRPPSDESPGRLRIDSTRSGADGRGVIISAPRAGSSGDRLSFDVILGPRETWSEEVRVTPIVEGREVAMGVDTGPLPELAPARRFLAWQSGIPEPSLEDVEIERVVLQSQRDLGSLRIFDPRHPERAVVAAGVPWFMALFGRDSLLTALMSLPLDPTLAVGTLQTLADLQGTRSEPSSEEQPGKILHEVRLGATTNLALGGGSVYYGTVDATPLFVVVLGELARWGGLPDDASDLLEAADRALEWIARDGDRDRDGFVEYGRLNEQGLVNQGWKDSWDGISFADGTLAQAPIALCEVQGYVYAAYEARATLAAMHGDDTAAEEWTERARELKREFNERFWLPDRGYFAIALDGEKRPVDSCSSNMGHCLWSGIVDDDKAAAVAERLLSPEMFTGWGVRTLASDMGAYNPASYHNGSVWPHDNAIIAAGLMRYGFVEEANRIVFGLFEAASHFGGRLPELFCGFDRTEYPEPVSYPASCSPQAWAAATPFSLLRTTLRFDPSVPTGDLWLAPTSTNDLGDIHLRNMPFAGARISVDASRKGASVAGLPAGVTFHPTPRWSSSVSTRRDHHS